MALKTESEVVNEGRKGFLNQESNPYLVNTWAYEAWDRGYREESFSDNVTAGSKDWMSHQERQEFVKNRTYRSNPSN